VFLNGHAGWFKVVGKPSAKLLQNVLSLKQLLGSFAKCREQGISISWISSASRDRPIAEKGMLATLG
jgi:hypothetical protein